MYVCVSQSPSKKVPREVMMFPDELMNKLYPREVEATSELKVANAEPRPKRAAASRAIVLHESSTEESDDDLPLASVVTKEKSSSAEARKNSSKRKRVAKEEPPEKREPQVAFDLTDDTPTPTQQTLDEDLVLTQQTQQTDATEGTQDYEKPRARSEAEPEFVVVLPEKGVSRAKFWCSSTRIRAQARPKRRLWGRGKVLSPEGPQDRWRASLGAARTRQSMLRRSSSGRLEGAVQLWRWPVHHMVLKVDKAKDARRPWSVPRTCSGSTRTCTPRRHHDSSAPEGRDVTKPRPKHKKARA